MLQAGFILRLLFQRDFFNGGEPLKERGHELEHF